MALGLAVVAFALFTPAGRSISLCPMFDSSQKGLLKSDDVRKQLATVLPSAAGKPLPAPLTTWRYLPIGDLVLPLPPGEWDFGTSHESLTLRSQSKDFVIFGAFQGGETAPLEEQMLRLVFGRDMATQDLFRMAFERNLATPCDPRQTPRRIFQDLQLMLLKMLSLPGELQEGFLDLVPGSNTFVFKVQNERIFIDTSFPHGGRWLQLSYSLTRTELTKSVLEQLALMPHPELVTPSTPPELEDLAQRAHDAGL